jgi:sugar/nucleoside kinase (ribokinase family)
VAEILVCGSVAIDVIGKYSGKFSDYEKRYGLSGLNVSLQLASLDFSFGGCGVNITWGLNQLGVGVVPVSVAGANFEDLYRDHLHNNGIDTRYISVDTMYDHCALAVILSDTAGNQLTAFHSGASVSPIRVLPSNIEDIGEIKLALLAPEDAPIMLKQARGEAKANTATGFPESPPQYIKSHPKCKQTQILFLSLYSQYCI